MSANMSPLIHVEMVVNNAEAAYEFLHKTLGAEKIEEEFSSLLDSPFMKIIHVGLGEVVLQFCRPIVEEGSHHEQLTGKGPRVHNLTYFVENIEDMVGTLEREGISTIFSFPSEAIEWDKLLGPENTRSDLTMCYIMGTMEKIGFHLELAEAPWKIDPERPVIYPAYSQPRPKPAEKVSSLLHIGVVVHDVEDACQFLHKVFGAEKLEEKFTNASESPFTKIIHVKLGNVVLQYYQPQIGKGPLYEHLKDKGPGVHHLAFYSERMDDIMKAIESQGILDLPASSWDWGQLSGPESSRTNGRPVCMLNTMGRLGFQIALGKNQG